MKVRFAIAPAARDADAERFVALVDGLERMGFDGLWLSDIPVGTTLDLYVALGLAAGRTERLKLGANVVPFGHNPVVLAKALAQLDQVSSGRLLLMLVPGLGQPVERATLGLDGVDRGALMDETLVLLRGARGRVNRSMRSGAVTASTGSGCRRCPCSNRSSCGWAARGRGRSNGRGRLADGWLGASMTPAEVARAVDTIRRAAEAAGRTFDPEHFGLSLAYAREEPDPAVLAALRTRRPDVDPTELVPVGADGVHRLVETMVGLGLSKFVLRPSATPDGASVDDELVWLADTILPLQT